MIKRLFYLFLVVTLFSITPILAQDLSGYTFPQNTPRTLSVGCNNASFGLCDSGYQCQISINKPSTYNIVSNGTMDFFNDGEFTYNLTAEDLNETGVYTTTGSCSGIGFSFLFEVNYAGNKLTSGQALIYLALFGMSIAFFLLTMFWAIRIKWQDSISFDKKVLAINDLKVVKIALFYLMYLELIWLVFLSSGIARNYLLLTGFTNFFYWAYVVLITLLFPLTLGAFFFGIILFLQDKKKKDAILRGVPIR